MAKFIFSIKLVSEYSIFFVCYRYTYRCARKSKWGDRMPIEFDENERSSSIETDCTDDEKL